MLIILEVQTDESGYLKNIMETVATVLHRLLSRLHQILAILLSRDLFQPILLIPNHPWYLFVGRC